MSHKNIILTVRDYYGVSGYLAQHKCSTNREDYISTEIRTKSNKMLVFEKRGKPVYPAKNPAETQPAYEVESRNRSLATWVASPASQWSFLVVVV